MLIKSQKKDSIVEMTGVAIKLMTKMEITRRMPDANFGNYDKKYLLIAYCPAYKVPLGSYDTAERCMQILGEISNDYMALSNKTDPSAYTCAVYEMPEK